jgi:tryptophan 2,3-dioxygenase
MTTSANDMNYWNYLKLEQLLSAQVPSSDINGKPAHDEMLFIIIHQVYELWFKQILHELDSVRGMFATNYVDEKNIGVAVSRLERVIKIQKLLVQQIDVIESLTPLDFLDFRGYLPGASGFQSKQFRMVENKLGLRPTDRTVYGGCPYHSQYTEADRQTVLATENEQSLFDLVDGWLARTPFLAHSSFDFLKEFIEAFRTTTKEDIAFLETSSSLNQEEKKLRTQMIQQSLQYVESALSEKDYSKLLESGEVRLSFKAFLGALFINLYRDQPIVHMPFMLLSAILDVDEHFNVWRHRHSMMVLRMIGSKMGTGGSSGHEYLRATVHKHNVFNDLYMLSTFYLPRSSLPKLNETVTRDLGFYFTSKD